MALIKLYHFTTKDFDEFDVKKSTVGGIYFADNKNIYGEEWLVESEITGIQEKK